MPFVVYKTKNNLWKIRKPSDNHTYSINFKSKQSATNMANRWMQYRHERPVVRQVPKRGGNAYQTMQGLDQIFRFFAQK